MGQNTGRLDKPCTTFEVDLIRLADYNSESLPIPPLAEQALPSQYRVTRNF